MPTGEQPNWFVHFYVCMKRYTLKMLRTRTRIYALCFILVILGFICGGLHGAPPARNELLIFFMIFNTLFSSVCATATSTTFGGDSDFFRHEAVSGVRQTAEGLARILVDVVWLAVLAPVFLLTLRSLAVLRAELFATWMMTNWAMSPLGYLFMLIAPANANVLTATVTVLICCLTNGFFGVKASMLGNSSSVLGISPGYNSYMLVAFGSCVNEPFDTTRAFNMKLLRDAGMLPEERDAVYDYEVGNYPWRLNAHRNLFLFGLAVRLIALVLFYIRSNYSIEGFQKHVSTRISDLFCSCCPASLSRQAIREQLKFRLQLAEADPEDHSIVGAALGAVGAVAAQCRSVGEMAAQAALGVTGTSRGSSSQTAVESQRDWLATAEMEAAQLDDSLDVPEAPRRLSSTPKTPSMLALIRNRSANGSPRSSLSQEKAGSREGPLSPIHAEAAWLPSLSDNSRRSSHGSEGPSALSPIQAGAAWLPNVSPVSSQLVYRQSISSTPEAEPDAMTGDDQDVLDRDER